MYTHTDLHIHINLRVYINGVCEDGRERCRERSVEVFIFLFRTLTGDGRLKWQITQIISLENLAGLVFSFPSTPW